MKAGTYRVELSSIGESGEEQAGTVDVVLQPVRTFNCDQATNRAAEMVGLLVARSPLLMGPARSATSARIYRVDGAPFVYLFENCVKCPNCLMEDIDNNYFVPC